MSFQNNIQSISPLFRPYVDTSSDEDYFPTNNNSNKKHPENRTQ